MLDAIIGQPNVPTRVLPSDTEPILDDDVFASIVGYLAPIPVISPSVDAILPAVESVAAVPLGEERVSYADAQIQEIDLAKIVPNPYQPRKIFDPEGLKELAKSIREHGVIQPLVVTETPSGYEIVVGERRFRASILAGMTTVPAIVKKELGDQTKLEVALIENIQRRELNAIEEARAYDRLIKTFNMTQEQVAQKVGKSRPTIANTLRLLNLPVEVQRAVIENKITEGHARALLSVTEPEKLLALFKATIEQNLNVRQVEAKAREFSMKRQVDAAAPDPKLMAIESELRTRLGAQVKVQRQGRGGKITIEFFSDEDLQDIMEKMAEQKQQQAQASASRDTPYFTV
ncbi:MAG: ParB/RepB/Spo0J family partition protein [Candidatus Doudnabacteria bacterium]|nr:ParB/RepB/Spo0J family partition protein [Candidatus Doudnabacteria bacterium]